MLIWMSKSQARSPIYFHQMGDTYISHLVDKSSNIYLISTPSICLHPSTLALCYWHSVFKIINTIMYIVVYICINTSDCYTHTSCQEVSSVFCSGIPICSVFSPEKIFRGSRMLILMSSSRWDTIAEVMSSELSCWAIVWSLLWFVAVFVI